MKNDMVKKLKSMRLPAFAEAYEKQIDQEAEYGSMSFHERLMLLVCNLRRAAATGAFASGHSAEHNGHLY